MGQAELLVLGGSGFLGTHVVRAALARGGVVSAARGPGVQQPEGILTLRWAAEDRAGLESALEREHLRGVILCAALARGAACEARPDEAHELNHELPGRVASACAARSLPLVHVSTDLVFGAAHPPPGGFREEDSPQPLGVYAESKRAGELEVLARHPAAIVARLPLLFGESFGRGLGASDGLLAALAAGRAPELFVDEVRTPLDVVEAAGALVELVASGARGLWHVAGPTRLSRHELGRLVLEAAGWDPRQGMPSPARSAERRFDPPRPADASLDASKARGLLRSPLSAPEVALRSRPPRHSTEADVGSP